MEPRVRPRTTEPRLSIGAVARVTGLSPDTLRAWQKRYGFPVPQRRPSGHRLFSPTDVRRLRRIAEALSRGHRPSQVVPLTEARLEALLGDGALAFGPVPEKPAIVEPLLALVRAHRGPELAAALLAEAGRSGPFEFLQRCVMPMIHAVGEGWARGDLGVAHEHFFSERLGDVLRALRLPFERGDGAPRVLLAAFSGETHALGLQVAAYVAAVSSLQPHVLGADTPLEEIVAASRVRRPAAIGISVSVSTAGAATRVKLEGLRRAVPQAVPILVGGQGARRSQPPGGCIIVDDLQATHGWMRRLAASR